MKMLLSFFFAMTGFAGAIEKPFLNFAATIQLKHSSASRDIISGHTWYGLLRYSKPGGSCEGADDYYETFWWGISTIGDARGDTRGYCHQDGTTTYVWYEIQVEPTTQAAIQSVEYYITGHQDKPFMDGVMHFSRVTALVEYLTASATYKAPPPDGDDRYAGFEFMQPFHFESIGSFENHWQPLWDTVMHSPLSDVVSLMGQTIGPVPTSTFEASLEWSNYIGVKAELSYLLEDGTMLPTLAKYEGTRYCGSVGPYKLCK